MIWAQLSPLPATCMFFFVILCCVFYYAITSLKTDFFNAFNYKSLKSNLFILRSNSVYCRKMEIIIIIKLQKTNWSGDYDEKRTNVEGNKKG